MKKSGPGEPATRDDNKRERAAGESDHQQQREIPSDRAGIEYHAALADYLDKLLDDALEETFPASDAIAVSPRR